MMIIKTGLADRYDARTFRQLTQWRNDVLPGLGGIGRMNADYGVDARIFLGKLYRAPAALARGADCDDARHPSFVRPTKDIIEVGRKIWVIEMSVGFNELRVES